MEISHELIVPNEDLPFKLFLFEGKDGNYRREEHWHRSVEIFALFEGSLTFQLGKKNYPLTPGEFILVNSNEVHSVYSPHPNHTVVLQIPLSKFERYYTAEQFIHFSHRSINHDQELMSLLRDMYVTYIEKETGYELKVQSEFYLLLYLLVSKYRETEVSEELVRTNRGLNRLSAITTYMKDNYNQELSLEELAGRFGYSPTYLSRMFRKYAGTNYKTFLNNIRMEYAWRDVVHTNLPIGEIAMKHGFANSKSLARIFREKYGETPACCRKKDKKLP